MNLEGKAAVVTGASRGVGRATALKLAERGCSVLINYSRSQEAAEQVVAEAKALGVDAMSFAADVSDDSACRDMMKTAADEFGRLDVLVNNAGTTRFIAHSDLESVTDDDWDRILAVNLKGPFQCIRAAQEFMQANDGGEIVNVASIAGISFAGSSIPYGASKAGLINLTISLARVLGPSIRVNAIAPGFIAGEWLEQGLGEHYDAAKKFVESRSALGQVCRPEDVADAIVSVIGGSDLITGQTVVVDGGYFVGPKSS